MTSEIGSLSATKAISEGDRYRIEMTVSCRDCDGIPKVDNAGRVIIEDSTSIQIMHNGVRVLAGGYFGDWMSEIIGRLRGHHEPQEEVTFHEILKHVPPKATMLELGGFWSYYSLWFLSSHPEQRSAFVVEPDPKHLTVGRTNAALNGRAIEFLQASVGAEPLPSKIFAAESVGAIQIPQISVPSFLREREIPYLDVLHCDTQGAETDIVQSCESLFRERCVGFGIFSTHGHHITGDPLTHQRCLAMLQDFGGRILAEHDVHESFSGDGLIAAYFGANELAWREPTISLNRYSTSLFRNPLYDLDEIRIRERSLARAELPAIEPEVATIDRPNEDRWYRKAQYRIDPNHKLASTIRKLKSGLKKVRQRTSSFRHPWRKTRERSKLAE